MKTFSIQTLGCKVNQYESEQVATLLRQHGLAQVSQDQQADLRVVNSCAVTQEAVTKSRQTVRRATRLKVLNNPLEISSGGRVLVMGCWSTSNPAEAASIPGVDAVISHTDPIADTIDRLMVDWQSGADETADETSSTSTARNLIAGACSLPLLDARQSKNVRAFLKIQDGCDAHCTYCIIPRLRPNLYSKPIDDAVLEAQQLVDAGHHEIVLTGIFMGAYGQPTALRRRQENVSGLTRLIDALCGNVRGLRRLRLSSLEPGDFTDDLAACLRANEQVVPHFHLPLQSGSAAILRKMNRQYSRDDFLRLIDRVENSFDRPALTTDIICGFPGESDHDFQETVDVVDRAKFIHVHAFPYSPREKTAAARWTERMVDRKVSQERIAILAEHAATHSLKFRQSFIGENVDVLVERTKEKDSTSAPPAGFEERDRRHHGRCTRYFDVQFESDSAIAGDTVLLRVDRVTETETFGTPLPLSAL